MDIDHLLELVTAVRLSGRDGPEYDALLAYVTEHVASPALNTLRAKVREALEIIKDEDCCDWEIWGELRKLVDP